MGHGIRDMLESAERNVFFFESAERKTLCISARHSESKHINHANEKAKPEELEELGT